MSRAAPALEGPLHDTTPPCWGHDTDNMTVVFCPALCPRGSVWLVSSGHSRAAVCRLGDSSRAVFAVLTHHYEVRGTELQKGTDMSRSISFLVFGAAMLCARRL